MNMKNARICTKNQVEINGKCINKSDRKNVSVHILKKSHDINGNPRYKIFIPELSGKIDGLRKLKTPHMYSFSSYNVNSYLKEFALKKYNVNLER